MAQNSLYPSLQQVEHSDKGSTKPGHNMEMSHVNGSSHSLGFEVVQPTRRGNSGKSQLNRKSTMTEEYCFGHCGRLHQKLWFKILVFLFLSALNIADLVSDWLLYSDVAFTQEGLVYGPPHQDVITALLVFSVFGSVVFLFEMVNMGMEVFKSKGLVDVDVASCISVWFEDIPQVAISVVIATCREEAISYFQLVKAGVVIIGVVIRIIITLLRYCSKKYLAEVHQHTAESCRHVATRAFMIIGLLVMCTGSVTVFVFTQTYRAADGTITFEVPENFIKGKYHDQRYFEDVSIFFHHHSFDDLNKPDSTDTINWVRMDTINNVRNSSNSDQIVRYAFSDITMPTATILFADNSQNVNSLVTTECYDMNTASYKLTPKTCPVSISNGSYTQIVFRLHRIEQQRLLLFGDIDFNIRILYPNGTFENEASFVDTVPGTRAEILSQFGIIHYFKTLPEVKSSGHAYSNQGDVTFYKNKDHLLDITHLWKTGFIGCEPTGRLAPNLDKQVQIEDAWFL